jgi:hypothetical protein
VTPSLIDNRDYSTEFIKRNRKVIPMKSRFILLVVALSLFIFAAIIPVLATTQVQSVQAGSIVYYCKGNLPWELNDFNVWVEQDCVWLPIIGR